jgi:hypothetical protein
MAEADWTYLNDGLDIATVDRGVTAGIARPPGGGSFLYAFNSLSAVEGAVGLFANLASFAPMAKGGSIRGVVQRGPGGGPTGFSPFLFLCCQGNSVNDSAYLLGLSDDDPHRIVLRKGRINVGPRKTRAREGEPLEVKILPLRLEADVADKMDEAWRAKGIKNRMEFFRGAIGHYLAHLGARDAAALFTNAGATGA